LAPNTLSPQPSTRIPCSACTLTLCTPTQGCPLVRHPPESRVGGQEEMAPWAHLGAQRSVSLCVRLGAEGIWLDLALPG